MDPAGALNRIAFLPERCLAPPAACVSSVRSSAAGGGSDGEVRARAETGTLQSLMGVGPKTAQVWAATSPRLAGLTGLYLVEDRDITDPAPSDGELRGVKDWAIDPEHAARLWELSAELTGVNAFTAWCVSGEGSALLAPLSGLPEMDERYRPPRSWPPVPRVAPVPGWCGSSRSVQRVLRL